MIDLYISADHLKIVTIFSKSATSPVATNVTFYILLLPLEWHLEAQGPPMISTLFYLFSFHIYLIFLGYKLLCR